MDGMTIRSQVPQVPPIREVLPLALRQRPENAVPEAANAAWVDEVVKEAPRGWDDSWIMVKHQHI
jgi:hypothetical protein